MSSDVTSNGKSSPLADRIGRLPVSGTAYDVVQQASAVRASGRKVYPFHIGDLNFRTPSVIIESCTAAMNAGLTGYCPAPGIPSLRSALAEHYNGIYKGLSYTAENVSIQPGGKPGIGKFLEVLCNEGDEVLMPTPGYPIYESMARYLGNVPVQYVLKEDMDNPGSFSLDVDQLEKLITPRTKALFFNNLQNPTGVVHSRDDILAFAELCKKHDLYVFCDDPYYKITFSDFDEEELFHIASIPGMAERTLCGFTFSKTYAMTGWRLGAVLGPPWLVNPVTKINRNACTTHFIQVAGVTALTHPDAAQFTRDMVSELEVRRNALAKVLNDIPGFHAIVPKATFYMMANVTKAMNAMSISEVDAFRAKVLDDTGVSFCTRAHFGTPSKGETQQYVRFAFSGVTMDDIEKVGDILHTYISKFF